MRTAICSALVLVLCGCSTLGALLPGSDLFAAWAAQCSASNSPSACLRGKAVGWAIENGREGSLPIILAALWAWRGVGAEEGVTVDLAVSGYLGPCPTSPDLWRGFRAPGIDQWTGDADQALGIWWVVFSCVGKAQDGDVVLDNGIAWSVVRRRFERQRLDGPGGTLDCDPHPALPLACEEGEAVAVRWSLLGDAAMARADVFGLTAQALARHGAASYPPWGVALAAEVDDYREMGRYLALCGLDGIRCPPADEVAGRVVLGRLP